MSDLVGDAFEGMWGDMKIKPKKPIDASQGSHYVQDVKPVSYRPQVQQGMTATQKYNLLRAKQQIQLATAKQNAQRNVIAMKKTGQFFGGLIRRAAKSGEKISKKVGGKVQSKLEETETYNKRLISHTKEATWKKYKKERRDALNKAQIDAYKEKLYGKPKKKSKKRN